MISDFSRNTPFINRLDKAAELFYWTKAVTP